MRSIASANRWFWFNKDLSRETLIFFWKEGDPIAPIRVQKLGAKGLFSTPSFGAMVGALKLSFY